MIELSACSHDTADLKCVCHCYNSTNAALHIAALEGAGIAAFAPWFHTVNMLPHMVVALNALPILVPRAQADDAFALLAWIEENRQNTEPAERHAATLPENSFLKILMGLIYYKLAAAPSLNMSLLTGTEQHSSDKGQGRRTS